MSAFHLDPRIVDRSAPKITREKYFNNIGSSDIKVWSSDGSDFHLHQVILLHIEYFSNIFMKNPNINEITIRIPGEYLVYPLKFFYGIPLPYMKLDDCVALFQMTDSIFLHEEYTLALLRIINKARSRVNPPEDRIDALKICMETDPKYVVFDTDISYSVLEKMPYSLFKGILPRIARIHQWGAVFLWTVSHRVTNTYHPDETKFLFELCPEYDGCELLRYSAIIQSYNTIPELRNPVTKLMSQILKYNSTSASSLSSEEGGNTYPPPLFSLNNEEERNRTPFSVNRVIYAKQKFHDERDETIQVELNDGLKRMRM
jgi:hypothetical protein